MNNLKTTFTNKDKYVLNNDDKDKIDKFIQQVDSTNEEYKKMQKLSITLNDVETELKENRKKVKILTENNDALNIKVKSLEKRKIDRKMKLMLLKRKILNYKTLLISLKPYLID